jgi:hypothetical protein
MSGIVFIAALVFVVLVLVMLFSPWRLRVVINHRTREVTLSWLLVQGGGDFKERTFIVRLFGQPVVRRRSGKKEEEKPESNGEVNKKEQDKPRVGLADLWNERDLAMKLIQVFLRLLWDLVKSIRWDKLRLHVELATPDPALTGLLFGQICAVKYSTECVFPRARIGVRPDFVNELPRVSGESDFSLRPVSMVGPLIKAFFAAPKIRTLKFLMRRKRR